MCSSIRCAVLGSCLLALSCAIAPSAQPSNGPTVTILSPANNSILRTTEGVAVRARYEGSADHPITRVDVFLGGKSRVIQAFTPGKARGELSVSLPSPEPGRYTLRVQVTDSAGRTAADTATVYVVQPIEAPRRFKAEPPWLPAAPDTRYWTPTDPPLPRGVPDPERYRFRPYRRPRETATKYRYWYPVLPARPCGTPPGWRAEGEVYVGPMAGPGTGAEPPMAW